MVRRNAEAIADALDLTIRELIESRRKALDMAEHPSTDSLARSQAIIFANTVGHTLRLLLAIRGVGRAPFRPLELVKGAVGYDPVADGFAYPLAEEAEA